MSKNGIFGKVHSQQIRGAKALSHYNGFLIKISLFNRHFQIFEDFFVKFSFQEKILIPSKGFLVHHRHSSIKIANKEK